MDYKSLNVFSDCHIVRRAYDSDGDCASIESIAVLRRGGYEPTLPSNCGTSTSTGCGRWASRKRDRARDNSLKRFDDMLERPIGIRLLPLLSRGPEDEKQQ
jgi:hypothetical protein